MTPDWGTSESKIHTRKVGLFLSLTFGIAWIGAIILYLVGIELGTLVGVVFVVVWAPAFAAIGTQLWSGSLFVRGVDSLRVNFDGVEFLLYAALLSLLVSRRLLDLVTEQSDDEIMFPPELWTATFRSHTQLILHELGEYLGYSPPPLLERLIEDAQKIHQQRPVLQETLATAIQPRCES
jgi:hypothetical protein